jgi:aminodeoxyfutalosine synthase
MASALTEKTLAAIRDKVASGARLSAEDGEFLFREDVDLHAVGELADAVRRRIHGNAAYYVLNAHLNPTNVCVYRCDLCAYSCDANDPRAFTLSNGEILERAREAAEAGCTELHIVGGANPRIAMNKGTVPYSSDENWDSPPRVAFDWYLGMIRRIHAAYPQLHLKAFSAVEIAWMAEMAGRPVRAILEELIAAGLGSLPGGGAEIFDPAVRVRICPRKPDSQTWLAVHRMAHELGLRTNATMLYGHVENASQRIDHLLRLRELQDLTGGFQAFVPLAFHPANTRLAHLPKPSGLLDLRVTAVSRLMLDNIQHIKAYWISLDVSVAQIALAYGADDLDGTVRHERIHHDAGAQSPEALSVDELRALIVEAGREPVLRK